MKNEKFRYFFIKLFWQLLILVIFTQTGYADFSLQIFSSKNKELTEKARNVLIDQGFKAYIHSFRDQGVSEETWYKLRVGPFSSREKTMSERERILAEGYGPDILVVNVGFPDQTSDQSGALTADQNAVQGITKENASTTEPENENPLTKSDNVSEPDIGGHKVFYDTSPKPVYNPSEIDYSEEKSPSDMVEKIIDENALHDLPKPEGSPAVLSKKDEQADKPEGQTTEEKHDTENVNTERASREESLADINSSGIEEKDIDTAPDEITPSEKEEQPENKTRIDSVTSQDDKSLSEKDKNVSPPDEDASPAPLEEYDGSEIITAGDILDITVPNQPQMSIIYDVDPDGNIFMLMIGKIVLGGLSIDEAIEVITGNLKSYIMKGDKVSIKLVEKMVYLEIRGGVIYTGWYRVPVSTSLNELVEMAGGLFQGVDSSQIHLESKTGRGLKKDKGLKGKIQLHSNDTLIVPFPETYAKTVDEGDLLFISIPGQEIDAMGKISKKEEQVQLEADKNGYIAVSGYGHIYVNGLTTDEISEILAQKLPKYLAHSSKVKVSIVEKKQYVQVMGHVMNPGVYNVSETANVPSVLNIAGGPVDGAVMSDICIKRQISGRMKTLRVNLFQYNVTGDPRLLTPLHKNDTLFIPISPNFGNVKRTLSPWDPPEEKLTDDTANKIRIFGAVNNPGVYEPKESMDFLDALIMAGGNRDDADLSRSLLIRNNKAESFNLKELLDKPEESKTMPNVLAGDTLYFSYVKKAGQEQKDPKELVRMVGAVANPGVFDPFEGMNLLDVLTLAKGTTDDADLSRTSILRRSNMKIEKIDLEKIFKDNDFSKLTIPINPGDTIFISYVEKKAYKNKQPKEMIRIFGAVRTPGTYSPVDKLDLLDVLAQADGFTDDADLSKILVLRGKDNNIEHVDFEGLLNKKEYRSFMLPRIFAGDTVYVGFVEKEGYQNKDPKEKVRIFGSVRSPGSFEPTQDLDLLDLMSMADGGDEEVDMTNIQIVRKNKVERVNLEALLRKNENTRDVTPIAMPKIYAGDTVIVGHIERVGDVKDDDIYVLGEVNGKGTYRLVENMTVIQAIAVAGGFTEWADKEHIQILRMVNGRQQNILYNFDKGVEGKLPELNVRLFAKDVIFVP